MKRRLHRSLGLMLVTLLISPIVVAEDLVPPAGYYAPVGQHKPEMEDCPKVPEPYTGELIFRSKYEGSDASRDKLNPQAFVAYKKATSNITELEKGFNHLVRDYMRSGHPQTLQCALSWLQTWAAADAMTSTQNNHTGRSMRKWSLGSMTSAYLRLKFSSSSPLAPYGQQTQQIEAWFSKLGTLVLSDWKDQPLERVNNHEYWAAWAAMADAVVLNRRDLFDWAVAEFRIAASQVDKDGYLPNELKRNTRALAYHNYSLPPLTMIAAFAKANGVDLRQEGNSALQRLVLKVQQGIADPQVFADKTGYKQILEDVQEDTKFAWLEPYCWLYGCQGSLAQWLQHIRPLSNSRLGGNLTQIFSDTQVAVPSTPALQRRN